MISQVNQHWLFLLFLYAFDCCPLICSHQGLGQVPNRAHRENSRTTAEKILTSGMPFLSPNKWYKSAKGTKPRLSLSVLTAIFPGGPGLASTRMSPVWILLELRVMEWVGATAAINRRAKLQSNRYHQQTNAQLFTGQMPFLSPNQQRQSTEGQHNTSTNNIKNVKRRTLTVCTAFSGCWTTAPVSSTSLL